MQETARRIAEDESLAEVEGRVASVKDIFRLAGNAELEAAERRYLPATQQTRAIILAASEGALGSAAEGQPKCLVDVRGRSVLRRLIDSFTAAGIRQTVVVRGFAKDRVAPAGATLVDNDRFADTGEAFSLAAAGDALKGELLVSYGDILFRDYILRGLLVAEGEVVLAVDVTGQAAEDGRVRDLVEGDAGAADDFDAALPRLARMGVEVAAERLIGEWIGLARFSARGAEWLREEMALLEAEGLLETADLPLLFTRIAAKHPVELHLFSGHWMDVDTLADLAAARNFT
jgi:phosphoenolpyruvate phosphomutase